MNNNRVMRKSFFVRKTRETNISVALNIDGKGDCRVKFQRGEYCNRNIRKSGGCNEKFQRNSGTSFWLDRCLPSGMLAHLIESFAKFGAFDIRIDVKGDLEVDQHHTIEDAGFGLGKAFQKALGDKKGIARAGYFAMPMDEALSVVAVDISGRPYLQYNVPFRRRFCGGLDLDTVEDFFYGFSTGLSANVVVRVPFGRSDHHKIESVFKGFGKAMKMACELDGRNFGKILSTKGVITRK